MKKLKLIISLEELLDENLFITKLDGALYSQFADFTNIFREVQNPKLKHISRKYYRKSYLMKYFSELYNEGDFMYSMKYEEEKERLIELLCLTIANTRKN
ncbi:hypothetical protein H5U44_14415 (plasmid) [Staphylococcus aureus]|nr:hypothetical protein [Staphylococcus aureus]ULX29175.1 hypothetical protein H5U44_14415 [Staphylococcus aureus]